MRLVVHTDGGSRGNPGPSAIGVVVRDAFTRERVREVSECIGRATNNVAEYQALLAGIEAAIALKAEEVEFVSDSKLMVNQVLGGYKCNAPELRELRRDAVARLKCLPRWTVKHVRREGNKDADALVNRALDAAAA